MKHFVVVTLEDKVIGQWFANSFEDLQKKREYRQLLKAHWVRILNVIEIKTVHTVNVPDAY